MDARKAGASLIKQLASCHKPTRDKALYLLLNTWLPAQTQISDNYMKKLWKGLFYCIWHADKLPIQAQLIQNLSSLLPSLPLPLSIHYFSVFLQTMRSEWAGIDALSPFLPLRKEVVEEVFGPFISLMRKAQDKVLLGKIKSGVFEVLLKMGKKLLGMKKSGCEADLADDVMKLGTTAMLMGFSAKFFEFGSSVECFQGNRTVLFGLHEEFLKLEKDLESSEIVISIPEVNDDVPNLVPVSSDMEVDESAGCAVSGSASKVLKKCKKAKVSVSNEQKEKKRKKNKKINLFSEFGIENGTSDKEKENVVSTACDILNDKHRADENLISFDQSTLSNLQLQFEKVAAEVGLDSCVESACDLPKITVNETVTKKRKRVKSANGQQSQNPETDQVDGDVDLSVKSREKSAKKVRFSMKNNLVWKPQSPLPPQSLRLPPSVTPRGSALKKGVPPGPIREMPLAIKKAKQRSKSAKKVRNVIKLVNPAHKSVKKLKSCSTQ
ncbi:uncharacterized protein LOC123194884 isoform X2 [Mangifera indica]|uniref:uncharacterized protein LOC123194884 isoform X2 n=1 Tax=Mangifera indica TaxID=29780 RepID=UPI001CF9E612|nr:uncharacterized protein LOC123194884 isoform X2 [Mangifera indica]